MFALKIMTLNDVFQPDPAPELARILRSMADRIEFGLGSDEMTIKDANGNAVGTASLKADG